LWSSAPSTSIICGDGCVSQHNPGSGTASRPITEIIEKVAEGMSADTLYHALSG
jgi:hypothetical protein